MRKPEEQPTSQEQPNLFSDFSKVPLPEEPVDDVPPPPEEDLPPEGYDQLFDSTRDSVAIVPSGRREKRAQVPPKKADTDLLTGLNPQQKEAVEHRGSPLLIVAGAGGEIHMGDHEEFQRERAHVVGRPNVSRRGE